MTLLRQGGWTRWPTEVPSNPYYSVILWSVILWKRAPEERPSSTGGGYQDPCKLEYNLSPWLRSIPNIFTPRFLSSIGFIPDSITGLSPDCGELGFPWWSCRGFLDAGMFLLPLQKHRLKMVAPLPHAEHCTLSWGVDPWPSGAFPAPWKRQTWAERRPYLHVMHGAGPKGRQPYSQPWGRR